MRQSELWIKSYRDRRLMRAAEELIRINSSTSSSATLSRFDRGREERRQQLQREYLWGEVDQGNSHSVATFGSRTVNPWEQEVSSRSQPRNRSGQ
ncbi:hypothetical protein PIB30_088306 [Stylosanthes scabra]|uniref:Uncharacterized protein n=1 Tax=Stylosanthes scabra TaxID=79078 RepID=A0ABU6XSN6_9FABA|nr:hypothetical protein [Stylosanthes scabra]